MSKRDKDTNKFTKPKWNCLDPDDMSTDCFGFLFDSMILSNAYQGLSNGEKNLLAAVIVSAHSETNKNRVRAYKTAENKLLGIDEKADVDEWGKPFNGYFIFSKQEQIKYGYSRSMTSRYMQGLIKAGFVDVVRSSKKEVPDFENKSNDYRLVNVYRMSCRWKAKEKKK